MNRRKKKQNDPHNDPHFDRLVKDIVRIIKKTDREIEKIRKIFPDMPNPLRKPATKRKVKQQNLIKGRV